MLVKMKKKGRWADPQPSVPQIDVEAGQEVEVSAALGQVMLEAGAAEVVKPKAPAASKGKARGKAEGSPAAADKSKAEG